MPRKAPSSRVKPLKRRTHQEIISRRTFLVSAKKAGCLLGLLSISAPLVTSQAKAQKRDYKIALDEILKGATPTQELLSIKMPEIAENGNVVSVTIDASQAQTDEKHVKSLHILATENPWPDVVTFNLSKLSGKPAVTSRMRLARSQKVVAIAKLEDGSFLLTEAFVKVTIGGCGG